MQDRYIFHGAGADQYCGRMACGLSCLDSKEFSSLPPHFPSTLVLTDEQWADIVPNYSLFPQSFQTMLPYLVASIVFHYDWIIAKDNEGKFINVNSKHPIHSSRIMNSGVIQTLKESLISNISGKCNITGMTATGI